MTDTLDYPYLINMAMRGLVRDVLKRVQKDGLPGEHHFYISFDTNAPGVKISDQLHERYPNEMTIVMQHQFWDFKVEDKQFSVTLSFSGAPEKLVIPFEALTAFADPSVKFGLQFQPSDEEMMLFADEDEIEFLDEQLERELGLSDDKESEEGSAEVISLDAFRKQ